MNRRQFFLTTLLLSITPKVLLGCIKNNKKEIPKDYCYDDTHNNLFTVEEIEKEGFIFVSCPTFFHKHNDHCHPIMKSCDENKSPSNFKKMSVKSMIFSPYHNSPLSSSGKRGIESLRDYHNYKDVYKPQIFDRMKKCKLHYVHKVFLGDSPIIKNNYEYFFPVFIRGCKLPTI